MVFNRVTHIEVARVTAVRTALGRDVFLFWWCLQHRDMLSHVVRGLGVLRTSGDDTDHKTERVTVPSKHTLEHIAQRV